MNDAPRRRRLDDGGDGKKGGGLPLVPLVILVVLAGLAIGGLATKYIGNHSATPQASPLPNVTVSALPTETPIPIPSVTPLPSASPSVVPSPKGNASPKTTASPVATASARPSSAPTATPTLKLATPKPVIRITTPKPTSAATPRPATPKPAAPKPAPTKVPVQTDSQRAAQVVSFYLDAMSRNDANEARSYLQSGNATETFMSHNAKVNYIRPTENGNGTWMVNADVTTDEGEYFCTFYVTVSPTGSIITDHTSIKPQ